MKKTLILIIIAVSGTILFFSYHSLGKIFNKPNNIDVSACGLYSATDARNVLGQPVKENTVAAATNSPKYNVSICSYSLQTDKSPQPSTTTLLVRRAANTDEGKAQFLEIKNQIKGVDVTGIGDIAYWNSTTNQLNVWKNYDWLIISAGKPGTTDQTPALKAANLILGKY